MATAQKKKTSAKRATKTAAKTAYSAATRSARATNHAATSSANEWAKQSAKLYQLPFANGDMEAAGKQAAAKIQNTAESMMKMGSDAMQQFWSQAQSAAKNPQASLNKMKDKANDAFGFAMPNMGNFTMPSMPKEAYGKFESFARETAESLTRSTSGAGEALNESMELSRENAEAVVEVSNIAFDNQSDPQVLDMNASPDLNFANEQGKLLKSALADSLRAKAMEGPFSSASSVRTTPIAR